MLKFGAWPGATVAHDDRVPGSNTLIWARSALPAAGAYILYTGVTRGKKLVVLIAQTKALAMAVKNQRARKRITRFAERLGAATAVEN